MTRRVSSSPQIFTEPDHADSVLYANNVYKEAGSKLVKAMPQRPHLQGERRAPPREMKIWRELGLVHAHCDIQLPEVLSRSWSESNKMSGTTPLSLSPLPQSNKIRIAQLAGGSQMLPWWWNRGNAEGDRQSPGCTATSMSPGVSIRKEKPGQCVRPRAAKLSEPLLCPWPPPLSQRWPQAQGKPLPAKHNSHNGKCWGFLKVHRDWN